MKRLLNYVRPTFLGRPRSTLKRPKRAILRTELLEERTLMAAFGGFNSAVLDNAVRAPAAFVAPVANTALVVAPPAQNNAAAIFLPGPIAANQVNPIIRINSDVSADFDAASGKLSVWGTGANDKIHVRQFNGQVYVDRYLPESPIWVNVAGSSRINISTPTGPTRSVDVDLVANISINGGAGDDRLTYEFTSVDPDAGVLAWAVQTPSARGNGAGYVADWLGRQSPYLWSFPVERLPHVEMLGQDGNDTLEVLGNSPSTLKGGRGNDTLTGGSANDRLFGEDGNDRLKGLDGDDYLSGGSGNDSLWGGNGQDQLDGGAHNDRLYGQNGNDSLVGQDGDDYASGGSGHDKIAGDSGDDLLYGDTGDDVIDGGSGVDEIHAGAGDDVVVTGIGDLDPYNDYYWESLDLGSGMNAAAMTPQTLHINSNEGSNALVSMPSANQPGQAVTKEQQKGMMDKFLKDVKGYFTENWDKIKNGEIPASEVAGKVYGLAATAVVAVTVPPLAVPAGALAEQYGQFYGDMFSDLVDIIKGQDEGTIGETVGKLAAMTFYATGIGYGTIVGTLPLAFGVDGWEFVKGLAAEAGGAFESAVDAIAGAAEDVWDWLF